MTALESQRPRQLLRRARRLVLLALWAWAAPAQAQASSFTAAVDRTQVPADDSFIYEVTLSFSQGEASNYRPPDFKDLRVVGQRPSESTQIQTGMGRIVMQRVYTWRYELQPLRQGNLVIGPARIRLDNQELRTSSIAVAVASGQGSGAPAPGGAAPPSPPNQATGIPSGAAQRDAFLRVVIDKPSVFVGEQVIATWYLYMSARPDRYQPLTEPRTDGFWSEDLPVPSTRNGLVTTQEVLSGRAYEAAQLLKKALFPLKTGQLTIGSMESEISQLDFFGASLRTRRLKAEPTTIDVLPLPTANQPAGFEAGNVGRYGITATVDRTTVAVGEPVALTINIRGRGNVRNVRPPAPPVLAGWKSYEPRTNVTIEPEDMLAGSKTIEVLLLPERPGTTIIPAFEVAFFDPENRAYATEKSEPLSIEVTPGAGGPSAAPGIPAGAAAGLENVLPVEVRPIHARPTLRRDVGATLYRKPWFFWLLGIPPVALALAGFVSWARERLAQDTVGSRRRRVRRMVRQRLGAAEEHRAAGRSAALFIEIDRVLREVLAARLGRPVAGLRMDELRERLLERGVPKELGDRIIAELEACDQARFAPGSVGNEDLGAALDRAGELILAIERARLHEEVQP